MAGTPNLSGDGNVIATPKDFDLPSNKKPKKNKYAFACALLASMTSILLGYDTGVLSGAAIYIKRDLHFTDVQIELTVGMLNIFSLLGSGIAGKTSDMIGNFSASNARQKNNDFSPTNSVQYSQCQNPYRSAPQNPMFSSIDELEQFSMAKNNNNFNENIDVHSGDSSNMKKASSTTNIIDDLSSIFGAAPSNGDFQDVEGETEERRRARLERHQRTQERAAQALAEKNQRDLQVQKDQEERNRVAETLDIEIRRWAAGKEGNLRALLSTLQYVLWPECGWQPVSLTDLITGASVKKVYRKATLCIHPDKVQQKGANLQQKYIAEKVFDLLKEAWNKFNSEELF